MQTSPTNSRLPSHLKLFKNNMDLWKIEVCFSVIIIILLFTDKISNNLSKFYELDSVYLYFSKEFDIVFHSLLLRKLKVTGMIWAFIKMFFFVPVRWISKNQCQKIPVRAYLRQIGCSKKFPLWSDSLQPFITDVKDVIRYCKILLVCH